MRTYLTFVLVLGLVLGLAVLAGAEEAAVASEDSSTVAAGDTTEGAVMGQKVVAYYFHGNRRCATCQKLEAYSQESITDGFAAEIGEGLIEWRVVNYDLDENKHFAEEYELFSQSVILQRMSQGKEADWKNLDQIWKLVGDKEKFVSYVREETKAFLASGPR